ncbi:hypothetical protein ACFVHR_04705 [Streptomyces sp. NPDC127168]|uniref:hypothetical protein n=1 Tax=unclassified Streptomyces TaxID=2593676 RepID=UPI0036285892
MTSRHTVDTITSDALDQLYAEIDRLTAELSDYDQRCAQQQEVIDRAREAARWQRRNYPGLRLANDTLTAALDGEQPTPAPAATQATGARDYVLTFDHPPTPAERQQIAETVAQQQPKESS